MRISEHHRTWKNDYFGIRNAQVAGSNPAISSTTYPAARQGLNCSALNGQGKEKPVVEYR